MGCWNKTCAISNLPIFNDEDVIGMFLVEAMYSSTTTGYHYHVPTSFYFEGTYNDYGAIYHEHGLMLDTIIEAIRSKLFEFDIGKNEYHDIEVKKDTLDFKLIMEADHEERLFIKPIALFPDQKKRLRLGHIQIRKDVFDSIIEQYTWYDWRTSKNVSFSEIMNEFDDFITNLRNAMGTLRMMGMIGDDLISNMLKRETYSDCRLLDAETHLIEMIDREHTDDEIYEVVENAVRVGILKHFMDAAHKPWVFPSYAGQEGETDAHTMLANIVIESAENISRRWDEEEEE